MQCMSPIRVKGQFMPCGRCPACMRNRSNEWTFRLNEELKISSYSYFFTLTYRDEDLPVSCYVPDKREFYSLCKRDVQLFLKRLRKMGYKFKYHIVGEYGPNTLRPHYHGMLFSQSPVLEEDLLKAWSHSDLTYKVFEPAFGRSAAGYCAKYLSKIPFLPKFILDSDRSVKPFTMCSKGLGLIYLEVNPQLVHKKISQLEDFVVLDGIKYSMPRYYRNKLFPYSKPELGKEDKDSLHARYKLRKQEFQVLREELAFNKYLERTNQIDCDQARINWLEYKDMIRKDAWRRAFNKYKNKKESL